MRVLVVTKIFPSAAEPLSAPFNRQQFAALAERCQIVDVLATIPYYPGAGLLGRWSSAGRLTEVPAREVIDGLPVRHPRTLFIPRAGHGTWGPLYVASLLPYVPGYRGRVDVVLASWAYPDGFAGVVLARLLGVPAVVKLHGSDVNHNARLPGPRRQLAWALPRAARVVAVSRALADEVAALGVARERVAVVMNGVDGERFRPADRWAVVDRSPTRVGVRRDPAEPAVGDVLLSPAFADDPENDRARRSSASPRRVARAARLLREPPADAAAVASVLRDRRGAADEGLPPGHRAAVDDAAAVHVVIIDPASLAMWVADGPGAGARMRAFDLRHELRGEGERPAPAADVPADATREPQAAVAIRRARAELRTARRLARRDRTRAREHVARALALAPALPEAHLLAGFLAQAAGDRAAMRAAWERWLELGADDPGEEAAIRAAVVAP